MDDKTGRMARELRNNPALLKHIMDSRDGQTLIRLLTERDNGDGFRQAVQSAANGDPSEMARRLRRVTDSPEGAALIARLQRAVEQ